MDGVKSICLSNFTMKVYHIAHPSPKFWILLFFSHLNLQLDQDLVSRVLFGIEVNSSYHDKDP